MDKAVEKNFLYYLYNYTMEGVGMVDLVPIKSKGKQNYMKL